MPIVLFESTREGAEFSGELDAMADRACQEFASFMSRPYERAKVGPSNDPSLAWIRKYGDLFQRLLFPCDAISRYNNQYINGDPATQCFAVVRQSMQRRSTELAADAMFSETDAPWRRRAQKIEYTAMLLRLEPLSAHFEMGSRYAEKVATGEIYLRDIR